MIEDDISNYEVEILPRTKLEISDHRSFLPFLYRQSDSIDYQKRSQEKHLGTVTMIMEAFDKKK